MNGVKQAYNVAKEVSEVKILKQILVFEIGYGFIFSSSRTENMIGGSCILVPNEDPDTVAIIPITFENLEFLNTGKELPLTSIL